MNIKKIEIEALLDLYRQHNHPALAHDVGYFAQKTPGVETYCVSEGASEGVVAVAFCDGGDGLLDLVVLGYKTELGVEQITPLLIQFVQKQLRDNESVQFDLVSFPCVLRGSDDHQIDPYVDCTNPGYREPAFRIKISDIEGIRIRLMHDAAAFKNRAIN
jgi:hypothetical protein